MKHKRELGLSSVSAVQRIIQPQSIPQPLEVVGVRPVFGKSELPRTKASLGQLELLGYGLMVCALLVCGLQACRCMMDSVLKAQGLSHQLTFLQDAHQDTVARKVFLKDRISRYTSAAGVEEMARERLGLVAKDEVLVRVYPSALASR